MGRGKGKVLFDLKHEVKNHRSKELNAESFGLDHVCVEHEDGSFFKLTHSIYEIEEKECDDLEGGTEYVKFLIVYTEHNGHFVWAMDDLNRVTYYKEEEDETITVH